MHEESLVTYVLEPSLYAYCTAAIIMFPFPVALQIGLSLLGIIVMVAVVNVWLLIPAAVMFLIFCILRVYFVATSRSVKRLEGISKLT
jgi:hypothetical protein